MKITGRGAVAGVCVFFAATCASAAELSKNEATKLLTFTGKENVVVAAAVGSPLAQDPFARLLAAAEGGDSASQLRVGVKYATGDGVRVNGSEAVRWLERAAASNGKTAATAAGWLGVVYERGMGVSKSGETAVRWYTRGVELGSGTSAQNLGELYLAGNLVKKNEKLGYEWYARAATLYEAEAAAGDAKAAYQAARIYHRGVGVASDPAKATALLEIASAAGNAEATKLLNEIRAQPRGGVAAERRRQPTGAVAAAPANPDQSRAGTVDPRKVAFLASCPNYVSAVVERNLNLIGPPGSYQQGGQPQGPAAEVAALADAFYQRTCQRRDEGQLPGFILRVHRGDPATLTEDGLNLRRYVGVGADNERVRAIQRVYGLEVLRMRTYRGETRVWKEYENRDEEERETLARRAAAEAARARTLEQQRQAELAAAAAAHARQAEIASRSAAFVKTHGVRHSLTLEQLAANPFVFQGQVVAVSAVFEQMISPTEAFFSASGTPLVVSSLPSGRFTQARSIVMLAGKVLGNREIKLPLLGATLAPHIAYVGSAFCQQQRCSDYAIVVK